MSRTRLADVGIILSQFTTSEADKVIKVFSKDNGLISLIAKGSRKLSSKKSYHLDTLNLISFTTSRGNSPLYLDQVESLNQFPKIKKNLKKTRTAMYILEILNLILADGQAEKNVFSSLVKMLETLNGTEDNYREELIAFQQGLISDLGFPPPDKPGALELIRHFEIITERKLVSPNLKIS